MPQGDNAGRPTDLTDGVLKEIKRCILDGKNLKQTANHIFENYADLRQEEKGNGVDNYIQKIYNWKCDNYLELSDKIDGWQRDYKLNLADKNIETILKLDATDKDFVRPVADMTKFVKETLDKKNYSKRSELTGEDGKELNTVVAFNYVKPDADNQTDEEATPSVE